LPLGTGQEKEEDVMKKFKIIAIWMLTALLAFVFLAFGAGKFLSPAAAAQFARWGYPDWLRTAIGVLEIGGALILLVPRVAWEGAVILALVLAGAIFTLLRFGEGFHVVLPALLLCVVAIIGYLRHPRSSLTHRLTAAADWVADQEIARQHRWLSTGKNR